MKFGISFAQYPDAEQLRALAQLVESSGFDSLWVTENVHSGPQALEPMVALSQFAAYTRSITIGPAVVLLPLRNPVGFAHAAATLDRLSGGRLVIGVGAGGDAEEGYRAYGVPHSERGKRCDETLEIMTALWSGEPVSCNGKFSTFSDYVLGGRPLQSPHPPIWIGGNAPPVWRRAGRFGDGFIPAHSSPAETAEMYGKIAQHRREWGRESRDFTNGIYLYVNLGESAESALTVAKSTLLRRYTYSVHHIHAGSNAVLGTPAECVAVLKNYQEAGTRHVILDPVCPPEELSVTIDRIAGEVIPHFR